MQQRIESAGTELVPVPGELLDEPQTEDGPLRGMMQYMKADQAPVEVLVAPILALSLCKLLHFVIEIRYRTVAVLCQALEKREDSQTASKDDGPFGLSLLHCTYATIQSVFKAFLASVQQHVKSVFLPTCGRERS